MERANIPRHALEGALKMAQNVGAPIVRTSICHVHVDMNMVQNAYFLINNKSGKDDSHFSIPNHLGGRLSLYHR